MKRFFLILVIILTLCIFNGCTTGESQKNTNEVCIDYVVERDMEKFVNSWLHNQYVDLNDNVNVVLSENSVEKLIVPELHCPNFVFEKAKVFKTNYQYFFRSEDSQEGSFSYDTGIWIAISREKNSFAVVVEQFDLEIIDNMAYDSQRNCWHMNVDSYCISINLPSNVLFESSQQVRENFTFDIITGSQTSSNVQ